MTNTDNMPLLQKALALFDKPVTLESIIEWQQLVKQAKGTEATYIGEIYEGLFNQLEGEEYQRWEAWIAMKNEQE